MRILVTGGNGFIGSNLIKRLLEEGHTVCSIDNLSTGIKEYEVDGCEYHYADLEVLPRLKIGKVDLCYHLAALSRIQPSFNNPKETFRSNTVCTQILADYCKTHNIKVVYAGSSSRWHDPYQSPYACYKHIGEEIFKLYRKVYNLEAEICRFYNVYGPGELVDGTWAAVIGIWRKQVRDGENITIVGDGEQRRDFTHVIDIVDGLYRVGMSNEKHEDAWELGTGTNYSINEVFGFFKERFPHINKVNVPDQSGNYRVTKRENDDSLDRLGWSPQNRLKEYILSL